MSIKGAVLEHLIAHPNEVVSLTALASQLDVTLDQVRTAVSNLRTGATKQSGGTDEKVSMRDTLRVVSRGYAVKYCPDEKSAEPTKPKPSDVPQKRVEATVVDAGSDARPAKVEVTTQEPEVAPVGVDHPYSDDLDVVLEQLGPVAHKVFSFVASQKGQNVTGDDVVEATGLSRSAVSSAFYNTLFNRKQLNRNARRMFVKVGKDIYRLSTPGDGVTVGVSVKHSGLPAVLPQVPRPAAATQKRIFEELRTLPDGSILIEDENGLVYKAREV